MNMDYKIIKKNCSISVILYVIDKDRLNYFHTSDTSIIKILSRAIITNYATQSQKNCENLTLVKEVSYFYLMAMV